MGTTMQDRVRRRTQRLLTAAAGLAMLLPAAAEATNGYFQHGYGTASKALAGAGAALSTDALAPSINPAGIAFTGNRVEGGLSFFHPKRSVKVTGQASQPGNLLTESKIDSDRPLFFIPNLGVSYQASERLALGVALYGNGGINTEFPAFDRQCPDPQSGQPVPGSGVFCAGEAGVDLMQLFLSPTAAYKVTEDWSVGVSPILAYQRFKAEGLESFAPLSQQPDALSGNGASDSFGAGVRVGVQGAATDWLRLGASYKSRIYMSRLDGFEGLFAEQGSFDVPPSWTVGAAVRPFEDLWLLVDVERILYSNIPAVGNPLNFGAPLGSDSGSGFGWSDMTVVKIGAQWQATADLTLRAGFSTTSQPVPEDQLLLNIVAPGVVEEHFTAGIGYRFTENWQLDAAFLYAPTVTVSGRNPIDPAQDISVSLGEFEATLGLSYLF